MIHEYTINYSYTESRNQRWRAAIFPGPPPTSDGRNYKSSGSILVSIYGPSREFVERLAKAACQSLADKPVTNPNTEYYTVDDGRN